MPRPALSTRLLRRASILVLPVALAAGCRHVERQARQVASCDACGKSTPTDVQGSPVPGVPPAGSLSPDALPEDALVRPIPTGPRGGIQGSPVPEIQGSPVPDEGAVQGSPVPEIQGSPVPEEPAPAAPPAPTTLDSFDEEPPSQEAVSAPADAVTPNPSKRPSGVGTNPPSPPTGTANVDAAEDLPAPSETEDISPPFSLRCNPDAGAGKANDTADDAPGLLRPIKAISILS